MTDKPKFVPEPVRYNWLLLNHLAFVATLARILFISPVQRLRRKKETLSQVSGNTDTKGVRTQGRGFEGQYRK